MSESNAARVLQAAGTEAVYTVCGFLKRYLTGFSFEDGCVIADRDGVTVYTDARYIEAAEKFPLLFGGEHGIVSLTEKRE